MTTINTSFKKTLEASSGSFFTGSGALTITLQTIEITLNTKRDVIKIPRSKSKKNWGNDIPANKVLDLGKASDTIVIRGWLKDGETNGTAWNQYWILRAMCVVGGQLTEFKIGDITFSTSNYPARIETMTAKYFPSGHSDVGVGIADDSVTDEGRIEVTVTVYMGADR